MRVRERERGVEVEVGVVVLGGEVERGIGMRDMVEVRVAVLLLDVLLRGAAEVERRKGRARVEARVGFIFWGVMGGSVGGFLFVLFSFPFVFCRGRRCWGWGR